MTPLEAALGYARLGWRVFPVHGIEGGACTCIKGADCSSRGKHPRTFNGVTDASADEDRIRGWWAQWPAANVGLATGRESGVWVLDIDPRHGGMDSLEEWEVMRGDPLPPTLSATSGGGGLHLVWRYPDIGSVRSRNGIMPGVDVKGDGGYVVAPPSRHESGGAYAWRTGGAAALAPADLLGMVSTARRSGSGTDLPETADLLKGVPEGARNDTLFRAACRWRRQLREDRDAVWALLQTAAQNCLPPYPLEEARKVLESAFTQDHHDPAVPTGLLAPVESLADVEIDHLTDEGNAQRWLRRWGAEMRHVPAWGWLRWDGARWARDEVGGARQLARETVRGIYTEASRIEDAQNRHRVANWAGKSEAAARVRSMLDLAEVDPLVARAPGEFDADPWLLNCRNGVVDLRTGELRPHERSRDVFTRVTATEYDPLAPCPRWLTFLERVLPDPDVREFLRRFAGYCLTGVTSEKVMVILHGSGQNGKTVLVEVLRGVMGDYAMSTPSSTLVERKRDAIPNDLARLKGARLATAQETREGGVLASEVVKEITGGDTISARFMRQEWFDFKPEFKVIMSTNHFPVVADMGDAIWDRLRLVPFEQRIPVEERVSRDELEAELLAEARGILAWAMGGCLAWREGGLTEPLAVLMATGAQREELDWVREFLEERCEVGEGLVDTAKNVYSAYAQWAIERGEHRPWTQNMLTRQLLSRGFQRFRDTRGARGFRGVRAKSVWSAEGV